MKKQYMQPEWRITVMEESFITTSINYSFGSFIDNDKVENWF